MELSLVELLPPTVGRPASPFIGEGEGVGYTRERERERERSKGEEGFQRHGALHFLHAGPADPVDHDGDGSMSLLCSSLALCTDVVS